MTTQQSAKKKSATKVGNSRKQNRHERTTQPTDSYLEKELSVDKEVGRRLREFRRSKGFTQAELGERLGISYQQVQKFERGVNRVGAGRLQLISSVLGVPPKYFFPECAFHVLPPAESDDEYPEYLDVTALSPAKQRLINAALGLVDEDIKMLMPLINGLKNRK